MTPEEMAQRIVKLINRVPYSGNHCNRRRDYLKHLLDHPSLKWPRAVDWRAPAIRDIASPQPDSSAGQIL